MLTVEEKKNVMRGTHRTASPLFQIISADCTETGLYWTYDRPVSIDQRNADIDLLIQVKMVHTM